MVRGCFGKEGLFGERQTEGVGTDRLKRAEELPTNQGIVTEENLQLFEAIS